MALNLLYLHMADGSSLDDAEESAIQLIEYAKATMKSSFKSIQALLRRLVQLALHSPDYHDDWSTLKRISLHTKKSPSCASGSSWHTVLALAIEAERVDFVEAFLQDHSVDCSSFGSNASYLRHALFPQLWSPSAYYCQPSPEIVHILLEAGYDPNADAFDDALDADSECTKVTPWRLWASLINGLEEAAHTDCDLDAVFELLSSAYPQDLFKITQLLVDAGADLKFLDEVLCEPFEDILARISQYAEIAEEVHALQESLRRRRGRDDVEGSHIGPESKKRCWQDSAADYSDIEDTGSKRPRKFQVSRG